MTKKKKSIAYWDLVEPVWESISVYEGARVFLKQFKDAPIPSQHLFAAHWCQSEVLNGGFVQFFANSTGVLAPEAIEGFKAIGMPKTAELVTEALTTLGPTYPRSRSTRHRGLRAFEAVLDKLDGQFFILIDSESGGFEVAADRFAASHGAPIER